MHTYLGTHPASWRAYYFLGYVQFRQRRISDSVQALSKSLELNTDNAAAHRILGRELSIIGRYDLALREFEEALRLDPRLGGGSLQFRPSLFHSGRLPPGTEGI